MGGFMMQTYTTKKVRIFRPIKKKKAWKNQAFFLENSVSEKIQKNLFSINRGNLKQSDHHY